MRCMSTALAVETFVNQDANPVRAFLREGVNVMQLGRARQTKSLVMMVVKESRSFNVLPQMFIS